LPTLPKPLPPTPKSLPTLPAKLPPLPGLPTKPLTEQDKPINSKQDDKDEFDF
jgi:hypothetical protein